MTACSCSPGDDVTPTLQFDGGRAGPVWYGRLEELWLDLLSRSSRLVHDGRGWWPAHGCRRRGGRDLVRAVGGLERDQRPGICGIVGAGWRHTALIVLLIGDTPIAYPTVGLLTALTPIAIVSGAIPVAGAALMALMCFGVGVSAAQG